MCTHILLERYGILHFVPALRRSWLTFAKAGVGAGKRIANRYEAAKFPPARTPKIGKILGIARSSPEDPAGASPSAVRTAPVGPSPEFVRCPVVVVQQRVRLGMVRKRLLSGVPVQHAARLISNVADQRGRR